MEKKKYITKYTDCTERPCFTPTQLSEKTMVCILYRIGQCRNLPIYWGKKKVKVPKVEVTE